MRCVVTVTHASPLLPYAVHVDFTVYPPAEDQPVVCIVGAPYSTAWNLPRVRFLF